MLVTQQPILKRFWYPVIPIAALAAGPQPFQLLGENLALWLDSNGSPAAVRDRCCHRSAKLSKGAVIAGAIRCPYHGWSFSTEGTCVNVPQLNNGAIPKVYRVAAYRCQELNNGAIPKVYRVAAYRCQERYGYVWVCLDEPLIDIPDLPEAVDPQFRQIPEFYEQWHCAGLRLMENSFDNAHPHFVHAKTFGVEQEPVPPQPDSFEETDFGLCMRYVLPVFNSEAQKQNLQIEAGRTVRISEGTWFMPFIRTLKITYPNGLVHLIFTAATPIDDRSSQIVQFCLRNDTEEAVTAASVVAFDRAVTLEDRVILEGTDYDVPLSASDEQHMMTDKPGIVMRRKLAALIEGVGRKF